MGLVVLGQIVKHIPIYTPFLIFYGMALESQIKTTSFP